MDILVRQGRASGVPVVELEPQGGSKPLPLVVLVHGYSSRKEFILVQGYHLAVRGFFVTMPDAWGHGERSASGPADFLEAVTRTAAEINGIIGSYAGRDGVDASRAGLAGFSMGGCITFAYLARGLPRVKAAAPVIGSPDWVSILESTEVAAHYRELGIAASPEDLVAYARRARELQPAGRLDAFAAVPLLVQNGEADALIPVEPVHRFCDRLRAHYADPSQLAFRSYTGVGHTDTVEMNLALAEWFARHLGGAGR